MTTPVDDHTQEEVQMDGSSLYGSGSSQLDCLSETSYGSDFGDNDEHDFLSMLDNTDIGLDDSPPPVYSNEGRSPSTFLPANTDLKSSPVTLGHTPPTISLSSKPTRLNTKFLGPSMCVVRGLIFNPPLIPISWYPRFAKFHPPTIKVGSPIQPVGPHVHPKCRISLLLAQYFYHQPNPSSWTPALQAHRCVLYVASFSIQHSSWYRILMSDLQTFTRLQ